MSYTTYRTAKANRAVRRAHAVVAITPPLLVALFGALLTAFVTYLALPVALLGALDSLGRLRDYRYLSSKAYINARVADFYGRSYCGRNVVCTINPIWRHYYRAAGYRWWHFLPDGAPRILLSLSFWRTLFMGHRQG